MRHCPPRSLLRHSLRAVGICCLALSQPIWAQSGSGAKLDPGRLLQLAVLQNSDLAFSRMQSRIATEGYLAETQIYQPALFANFKRDGRQIQRSVEEQLAAVLGGITTANELGRTGEAGARMRTPTGAELSLSMRVAEKRSNIIASSPTYRSDTETSGIATLTIRQPLLRGAGRKVMEVDLRVAEAERDIAAWQYRQQLLRIGNEALSAYWQLQRAQETQSIRHQALANARELKADVLARVSGGRLAPGSEAEATSMVASREADLARNAQQVSEAESRIQVLLDLPPQDRGWPLIGSRLLRDDAHKLYNEPVVDAALIVWPAYQIALLRKDQAERRLELADNRKLPALDLQLSYANRGLDYGVRDAISSAFSTHRPDWGLGVTFDIPLGEDVKAKAQHRAQRLKVEQSELELKSVRNALANELSSRAQQFNSALLELTGLRIEQASRIELFEAERLQFQSGIAPLNRLLRREGDLLESRLRLIDGAMRAELALVALRMSDGTLLSAHEVRIEN